MQQQPPERAGTAIAAAMRMRNLGGTLGCVLAGLGLLGALNACQVFDDETESSKGAYVESGEPSLYQPGNRFLGWGGEEDLYLDKVQPILGKRCVTCHGCTTSPCQLKLTSYEGVMRGANKHNAFDATVFSASTGPTRLKDGVTADDWRAKGFYSVVDGGKSSIMFKMLEHGNRDNQPGFDLSNAFGLYEGKAESLKFECLDTRRKLDSRLEQEGTGMPFGLPALPPEEFATLLKWLEQGAPGPSAAAKKILDTPRDEATVAAWEDFFNQTSPKARLASRFIYEHVFFGRIHIDDSAKSRGDFFDLVRSRTRTGPIEEIVTERPNDDPRVTFYYRLKKHTQLITAKDHSVFHFTDQVMNRWKELFFDSAWELGALPDYDSKNPFVYFEKIPAKIRYQFMLENSHHLIDAMVKGDVCNGSTATYAIRDRFGALFLKPESDPSAIDPKLGRETIAHLDPNDSTPSRDQEFGYFFEMALRKLRPRGLSERDLWDGGKKDKNAWITVFRHGNNASAHQGPIGQFPETMWVLDFGNFERLYYSLVVLYRGWGPVTHKLSTWSQMSHIRAHGEDLFLLFFPEAIREKLREDFTSAFGRFSEVEMSGPGYPSALVDLDPERPAQHFISRVRGYLGPEIAGTTPLDPDPMVTPPSASVNIESRADLEATLYELTLDRGKISDDFPDVTWVTVRAPGQGQSYDYTVLANRIFKNHSSILGGALTGLSRLPKRDSLSVVRGHIGAFPQLFLEVPMEKVGEVVKAVRGTREQRAAVRTTFEVRRNSPEFWEFLDAAHKKLLDEHPLEAGIIDTSRYVWPLSLQSDPAGAVE